MILIFGDSLTAGFGLPQEDGLVLALSRWLATHGAPARLMNGGLTGDTTYGGRVRIGPAIRRYQPDAVVVELGANDMLAGWDAKRARRNLAAILRAAGGDGRPVLLVGIALPVPRAAEWREMWPAAAQDHDALLLPDLAADLTALPVRDRAAYLQQDGLHPSARGAAVMAARLGPAVQKLVQQLDAARAQQAR